MNLAVWCFVKNFHRWPLQPSHRPTTAPRSDIHLWWQQPDNDFGLRSSVPHVHDSELTHPGECPAHFRASLNGSQARLRRRVDLSIPAGLRWMKRCGSQQELRETCPLIIRQAGKAESALRIELL